tara:strand:+ start:851 stop:1177 length:327 start_codon:yes stop_codon:yes gene_type:complete
LPDISEAFPSNGYQPTKPVCKLFCPNDINEDNAKKPKIKHDEIPNVNLWEFKKSKMDANTLTCFSMLTAVYLITKNKHYLTIIIEKYIETSNQAIEEKRMFIQYIDRN